MKSIKFLTFLAIAVSASITSFAEQFTINYPENNSSPQIAYISIKVVCTPPTGSALTFNNFPNILQSPAPSFIFYSDQLTNCPANSMIGLQYFYTYNKSNESGSCSNVTLSSDSSAAVTYTITYSSGKLSCKVAND